MNQNTPNESELAFGAKLLASASGTPYDEAHERMARVVMALNSATPGSVRDALKAMHKEQEDERWRTDPLGLMPLFSLDEWRWKIADLLWLIGNWIEP